MSALLLAVVVLAAPSRQRLVQLLSDPRYKIRIQAAAVLAKQGDPASRLPIEDLLDDKHDLVRAAACDALATLDDPGALPALQAVLRDENDTVRRRARLAIRLLKATRKRAGQKDSAAAKVKIDMVTDASKAGIAGLDQALRRGLEEGLQEHADALGKLRRRYQLIAQVRSVERKVSAKQSKVTVKCQITVVELPRRTMRLSTQVTAAAALDGRASKGELGGLAGDVAIGAGVELIREFSDWAVKQPPP